MIHVPWKKFCMIWVFWHLSDGFSWKFLKFERPFRQGSNLKRVPSCKNWRRKNKHVFDDKSKSSVFLSLENDPLRPPAPSNAKFHKILFNPSLLPCLSCLSCWSCWTFFHVYFVQLAYLVYSVYFPNLVCSIHPIYFLVANLKAETSWTPGKHFTFLFRRKKKYLSIIILK